MRAVTGARVGGVVRLLGGFLALLLVAVGFPQVALGTTNAHDTHVRVDGDITVESDDVVDEVVAVGGSVWIYGRVEGDVVAVAGDIHVASGGIVDGDVVSVGGVVQQEAGSVVSGDVVEVTGAVGDWVGGLAVNDGVWEDVSFALPAWARGFALLSLFALGMLLVAVLPERVEVVVACLNQRWGKAVLFGMLWPLAVVPLCVFLAATILGIPLIPLVLMLAPAFGLVGYLLAAVWLGMRLPLWEGRKGLAGAFAMGLVLLALVELAPVLGFWVGMLAAAMGSGALLLSRFGTKPLTVTA